ncbi:sortase, SrtB family [Enterococcus faecalis 13-SD-W-01]|nr:sortase, SrtB family [Enterococcus faecalis 13-SD-W-01]
MEFTLGTFYFNDSKIVIYWRMDVLKRLLFFLMLIGILDIFWINLTYVVGCSERQSLEEANHFLQQKDVYAYLKVEGTPIDYPIAQHPTDDRYYLSHDVEGNKTIYGAIFTERINAKDFNDAVTIIYGHATRDDSMFGTLSHFAEKNFFDKHKVITIQTRREHITYEVFAAYSYTDTHLFDAFHLEDNDAVKGYFEEIKKISVQLDGNYREIARHPDQKLVILSTCDAEKEGRRFIVHAIEKEGRDV